VLFVWDRHDFVSLSLKRTGVDRRMIRHRIRRRNAVFRISSTSAGSNARTGPSSPSDASSPSSCTSSRARGSKRNSPSAALPANRNRCVQFRSNSSSCLPVYAIPTRTGHGKHLRENRNAPRHPRNPAPARFRENHRAFRRPYWRLRGRCRCARGRHPERSRA
jgi:hypothetical protein